jgi:hypothetical protein
MIVFGTACGSKALLVANEFLENELATRVSREHRNGAPRPMKMGNILSPWRYDAMADYALQLASKGCSAILHCAS